MCMMTEAPISEKSIICMRRIIHPVGQGAFYTEDFYGQNGYVGLVVYDCGTTKKAEKERLKEEIKRLPEGKDVDILFISHFDKDHVCGIKDLMQGRKIKRVVIPQISGFEWFYIVEDACMSKPWVGYRVNRHLFDTISDLAHSDSVGDVVEVKPINDEGYHPGNIERPNNDIPENDRPLESQHTSVKSNHQKGIMGRTQSSVVPDSKSSTFSSGDNVYLDSVKVWEYIPFNYTDGKDINNLKDRINNVLRNELTNNGYNSIDQVPYQEVCNLIEPHLAEINKEYKNVFGSSNASSMCVYSGCLTGTVRDHFGGLLFRSGKKREVFPEAEPIRKEACLYTGDSVLINNDKLKFLLEHLGDRNKHIGLFQIPHHGSRNNFDLDSLDMMRDYGCMPDYTFICYGTKNRYKHPSIRLVDMLLKKTRVCSVNENLLRQEILIMKD